MARPLSNEAPGHFWITSIFLIVPVTLHFIKTWELPMGQWAAAYIVFGVMTFAAIHTFMAVLGLLLTLSTGAALLRGGMGFLRAVFYAGRAILLAMLQYPERVRRDQWLSEQNRQRREELRYRRQIRIARAMYPSLV